MSQEKVLIIAIKKPYDDKQRFQSSLDELTSLTGTAGGAVKEIIIQNRKVIHPSLYIGEGKTNEIKQRIDELDIESVIVNDELSSGQIRNLQRRFNVPIIDRSQLILDIFSQRAHTKEGQLQVELAQLEYMLPRLHGKGVELSRLGGGIGTRGPGETKLETDQRHIRGRIQEIKRRLKAVVKQRKQYRKRRKTNDIFQLAIAGYTNAGKSTLFNRLTDSESFAENKLFATLDPLTRKIHLPSGLQILVTDTVGFIQELPTALIAAFRSTLEEVTEADFILHVVDVDNKDRVQQESTVIQLLDELGASEIPRLTIYNKKDLLDTEFIPTQYPYIVISAFEQEDIRQLLGKIETTLKEHWEHYVIELLPSEANQLYRLQANTIVEHKRFDEYKNKYVVKGFIEHKHSLKSILKESQEK